MTNGICDECEENRHDTCGQRAWDYDTKDGERIESTCRCPCRPALTPNGRFLLRKLVGAML